MPDSATPFFGITESAARRVAELRAAEGNERLMLRVAVDGGGCNGFQYRFDFDDAVNDDDTVFERDGVKVVVDEISLDFLGNAQVDFKQELIGSYFAVENPNATSNCGCGTSFSVD
ncbi:MAG: iron-sulfur cluster insertion protein ErpA [Rhodospirillaceae bacterium]|nr:iron-sulfur cluster insertion protein ErpA [Rhodospirillaceae bacterium]MDE0617066.1 iron-sulfur cluster insertion protein ErpA [Rhodospirillaceae bacterium]MDE0718573.1 iron-sulfur cluster insertion protein ErpA [Rhodospirillaceae bacterium]MXY42101.1 iron-sulfur cluster insertion protein ErpA [Rhodospirillaceae bacterium]MYF84997.1 iron-sulfur cluster insertion protein ErpA [Rhodospirillaceae bacterium]